MASRFVMPREQVFDANGHPMSGAKLYFYITSTTTPVDTFSDSALTTPNANPVVADSAGRFGEIYLTPSTTYKAVLKDSSDVTIWTADPVTGYLWTDNATTARTAIGAADTDSATETAPGLIELATQAEVNTGTDTARAVTPATLAAATSVGKAIVADSRNLVVAYATAATVTVTADELILKTSGGAAYLASTVSLTADMAGTVGTINSLDTGSEASGTWYYVWVIYNGTTVASLLSASSSSPTLPSGYTYKALVGAVRNDGSSNFIRFYQNDRRVALATQNIFSAQALTTSYASQSISAAVPPIARFV
ncbi:MAG: hypothetical protein E6Q97_33795, partial [Desulfurellales bacterium]